MRYIVTAEQMRDMARRRMYIFQGSNDASILNKCPSSKIFLLCDNIRKGTN
jgi:hypothetical protein